MQRRTKPTLTAPVAYASLSVILVLICIGCTVAGRHRALNFFFDGVPPLGSGEGMDRLTAQAGDTMSTATRRVEFQPVMLSVHEPVRARNCSACHGLDGNDMMVIADDITLCDQCHGEQRIEEQWAHGPINEGTCYPCHVPHKSRHESLLIAAVPDLCASCHQELRMEEEYHAVPNFQDCLACHDAHRIR